LFRYRSTSAVEVVWFACNSCAPALQETGLTAVLQLSHILAAGCRGFPQKCRGFPTNRSHALSRTYAYRRRKLLTIPVFRADRLASLSAAAYFLRRVPVERRSGEPHNPQTIRRDSHEAQARDPARLAAPFIREPWRIARRDRERRDLRRGVFDGSPGCGLRARARRH